MNTAGLTWGRPAGLGELVGAVAGGHLSLAQETMTSGPPEQWDRGQGGTSLAPSAFSHAASKEIPRHCIYKASPTVSFLEHNVFNKKPLSLVKLSEI